MEEFRNVPKQNYTYTGSKLNKGKEPGLYHVGTGHTLLYGCIVTEIYFLFAINKMASSMCLQNPYMYSYTGSSNAQDDKINKNESGRSSNYPF